MSKEVFGTISPGKTQADYIDHVEEVDDIERQKQLLAFKKMYEGEYVRVENVHKEGFHLVPRYQMEISKWEIKRDES